MLQLGHTTTVWLWLNTVVLQQGGQAGEGRGRQRLHMGKQAVAVHPSALPRPAIAAITAAPCRNAKIAARKLAAAPICCRCRVPQLQPAPSPALELLRPAAPPLCCGSSHCSSHGEAALALHVHEVRVGSRYQAMELVLPLLQLRRRVQQVDVARQHLRAGSPANVSALCSSPGRRGPRCSPLAYTPRSIEAAGRLEARHRPCWPPLMPRRPSVAPGLSQGAWGRHRAPPLLACRPHAPCCRCRRLHDTLGWDTASQAPQGRPGRPPRKSPCSRSPWLLLRAQTLAQHTLLPSWKEDFVGGGRGFGRQRAWVT